MKYSKPHFKSYEEATKHNEVNYPYSAKMIGENDIFSLIILDGGAFFFLKEYLGDTSGDAVLSALREDRLLAPWTVSGKLGWDYAYDSTLKSQCNTHVERHVWLNRLYFLLPIAREFFKTGDEKMAKQWYQYLVSWDKAHPYNEATTKDPIAAKHCWRDMQVTWRFLVMIHSINMLAKSRFMTKARWHKVYRLLKTHSLHILKDAQGALANGTAHGNHFLQKATALLYCAVLFPEFEHAGKMMQTGKAGIKQQMTAEVYDDGGNVEASPSYSCFIARLYLDAYLLLHANGYKSVPGLKQSIRKQYRHLEQITTPQEKTLQISDSYALDMSVELGIVRQLFPLPTTPRSKSVCYHSSQIAVLRNKRAEVFVDAMPRGEWHHHKGRPNVLVYIDGSPFMVDSGVCNYDSAARDQWFVTPQAHNVVIVSNPDMPLADVAEKETCEITGFTQDSVAILSKVDCDNWSYRHRRRITLERGRIILEDVVSSDINVDVEQRFHFANMNVVQTKPSNLVFQMKNGDVTFETSQPSLMLNYRTAYGSDNRPYTSPEVSTLGCGERVRIKTSITF